MFPLGQTVATPGALEALQEAGLSSISLLARHQRGDWGDLDPEDRKLNEQGLAQGGGLISVYTLHTGAVIWVITEGDRSITTVLLPEEY